MALAIGVIALPGIDKTIDTSLTQRWKTGNFKPLNIIICENLLNAKQFLEELIIQELTTDKLQIFRETIGLVEASIRRMVPVADELAFAGQEKISKDGIAGAVREFCGIDDSNDMFGMTARFYEMLKRGASLE